MLSLFGRWGFEEACEQRQYIINVQCSAQSRRAQHCTFSQKEKSSEQQLINIVHQKCRMALMSLNYGFNTTLINDVNQSLLRTSFLAPRGESTMLHATRLGWASLSKTTRCSLDTHRVLSWRNHIPMFMRDAPRIKCKLNIPSVYTKLAQAARVCQMKMLVLCYKSSWFFTKWRTPT